MSEGDKTNITVAGDWAKPADTLINKVSDAIGSGLKPWQIRRMAKAEADAKLIGAEAEKQCKDILAAADQAPTEVAMRAVRRMIGEEIKKQENIERIVYLATERLAENAKPEQVEDDFISDLFEKARHTSNEKMQSLWASILSGEANRAGSFSKRTVALVSELDQSDADLFTKFCSCCWMLSTGLSPLLTSTTMEALKSKGINFTDFVHLDSIGLIKFDSISTFRHVLEGTKPPARFVLHYFGQQLHVVVTQDDPQITIGHALLTEAGRELAVISGAKPDLAIRDAALSDLIGPNKEVLTPWIPDKSKVPPD